MTSLLLLQKPSYPVIVERYALCLALDPEFLAMFLNEAPLTVSAAESPTIVPGAKQTGARRVVSGVVKKSVTPDRIYRRD
jgi:hypothetical protein